MENNKSNLSLVTMSELQKRLFHKPMEEIAKEIEDQILVRLNDVEILRNMLKEFPEYARQGNHQSSKASVIAEGNAFPGYPMDSSLTEKFEFLEQIHMRMWNKREMEKLITQAEGEKASKKTLHNFSLNLSQLPKKCRLIKMQYGKSKWHCFYTTNIGWIETVKDNDKEYFSLIPKHAPDQSHLKTLSSEMMQHENIQFTGIEK